MEKEKRVSVIGSTITGEKRNYKFNKMDSEVGLRIYHEYGSIILANFDSIMDSVSEFILAFKDADKSKSIVGSLFSFVPCLRIVPQIITYPRLTDLCKSMLSGGCVDGEELDEQGLCDKFGEEPMEVYTALFYAFTVNYPKYSRDLSELIASLGSDSEKTEEKQETEKK